LLGPGGWASGLCCRKPGGRGWAPGHARPCRRSCERLVTIKNFFFGGRNNILNIGDKPVVITKYVDIRTK